MSSCFSRKSSWDDISSRRCCFLSMFWMVCSRGSSSCLSLISSMSSGVLGGLEFGFFRSFLKSSTRILCDYGCSFGISGPTSVHSEDFFFSLCLWLSPLKVPSKIALFSLAFSFKRLGEFLMGVDSFTSGMESLWMFLKHEPPYSG